MMLLAVVAFWLLPSLASAQTIDPCAQVGGCNPLTGYFIIITATQQIAKLMVATAAGGSVLAVVIGAGILMTSLGDDTKVTRGRNCIIFALVGFALVLAAQVIISFVVTRVAASGVFNSAQPILDFIKFVLGTLLSVFNIVFVIVMIIGGMKMIFAQGKTDETGKLRTLLTWAVIGAIVVNCAHALVRALFFTGFGGA